MQAQNCCSTMVSGIFGINKERRIGVGVCLSGPALFPHAFAQHSSSLITTSISLILTCMVPASTTMIRSINL